MTRDDIIRMAREAGFAGWKCDEGKIERLAALAAAAEREACAQVCEELRPSKREFAKSFYDACTACAEVIRGRSNA